MDDTTILGQVRGLVAEERGLRDQMRRGQIDGAAERERLQHLEEQLDQCWDLLRRRRAAVDAGQDPDAATVRNVGEVEGYLQ
ncbi:MAG: DUF2630 family protein [Streptosporangiales bacterium]